MIGVGINLWKAGVLGGDAGVALGVGGLLSTATAYLGGVEPYHWFDFINNKALYQGADVGALSAVPGYSFSRASTGYYTNADGTLTSFASGALRRGNRGVLIEGARTNLLLRSQEFDNASWANNINVTLTAAAGVAPDGTTTAYSLAGSSSTSNTKRIGQNGGSAAAHTLSIFAKAGTHSFIQFYIGADVTQFANFNLATGAVGTVGAGATATITALANGWYRCTMTVTLTGSSAPFIQLVPAATSSWAAASTTTNNVLIWGAQLEAASFPSSYIPTTTASATRAADVLTCTAGVSYPLTLWAEFERAVDTGGQETIFQVDAGDNTQSTVLAVSSADVGRIQMTGGANAGSAFGGAVAVGVATKLAGRALLNDCRMAVSGTLGAADTTADYPSTPTTMRFGVAASSSLPCFGYLRRAAIFNSALTNANLQSVTT